MRSGELQKIHRAVNVGFDVQTRLLERGTHASTRGQVNDTIVTCLLESLAQSIEIANVGREHFEIRIRLMVGDVRSLDRRVVEVVKVVDDRNLPDAFGNETIDQVRTNETRAAGD